MSGLLCADYRLTCLPGVQPARAILSLEGVAAGSTRGQALASRSTGGRTGAGCIGVPPLLPTPSGAPCQAGETYVLPQCSATFLVPPALSGAARAASVEQPSSSLNVPGAASAVDVLLATSDHAGHGMFAIVERVINQILLARRIGARVQPGLRKLHFSTRRAAFLDLIPRRPAFPFSDYSFQTGLFWVQIHRCVPCPQCLTMPRPFGFFSQAPFRTSTLAQPSSPRPTARYGASRTMTPS
jgi:hypothetical protein